MAANDLTQVVPQILAQGLLALRSQTILPFLVNRNYSSEAAEIGDTIDVNIPSAIAAAAVTAGATPPATEGVAPTKVQIQLNKWYEAAFYLTDKEQKEAMKGTIPMQASAAVKSLANQVNSDIFAEYKGIYGYVGTAATTPFASTRAVATQARKTLLNQNSPLGDLRMVLDPDAEANAIDLSDFADSGFSADSGIIKEGVIGRKVGFDWFVDQQVPTHTAGTLLASPLVNGTPAVGATTMNIDKTTLTGTVVVGDIFTIAGDSQTYVVTAAATAAANALAGLEFLPGLVVAPDNDAVITFKASHVVNMAFHRDAFALATRSLEAEGNGLGNIIRTISDAKSGLTLRLEVSREHKRTRWSFDILYGVKLVRAALAVRVAG